MQGTCETCPYLVLLMKDDRPLGAECHRNPPTVFMTMQQGPLDPKPKPGWTSVYPPTRPELGCGEHPLNRGLGPNDGSSDNSKEKLVVSH